MEKKDRKTASISNEQNNLCHAQISFVACPFYSFACNVSSLEEKKCLPERKFKVGSGKGRNVYSGSLFKKELWIFRSFSK